MSNKREDLLLITRFRKTFTEYYKPLLQYANSIICDFETSKDIMNEVFKSYWEKIDALDQDNEKNYLYTCVRNKCVSHLRHLSVVNAYARDYLASYSDVYADYEDEIRKDEIICKLVNELPQHQQTVIRMHYIDDMSIKEIGDKLDISPNTIKKYLMNARTAMRELYQKMQNEETI